MDNLSAASDTPEVLEPNAWLKRELDLAPALLRTGPGDSRRAPGWFDSSWELRAGLEVREGLPEGFDLEQWLGSLDPDR